MRRTSLAFGIAAFMLAIAATALTPALASDDSAVMATVNRFVDGYNHADFAAAAKACASPATVVDEFAPHIWTGSTACTDWGKAYVRNAEENHITKGMVTMGKPWQLMVDGDRAYVVLPVQFHWLQNGKPGVEPASVYTLVLGRTPAGWRIMSWTWSEH